MLRDSKWGRWDRVVSRLVPEHGAVLWVLRAHDFPPASERATAAWCIYLGELMKRHAPEWRWQAMIRQEDSTLRTCNHRSWRSISHPFLTREGHS